MAGQFSNLLSEVSIADLLKGKVRVDLLKEIEAVTKDVFEQHPTFESDRLVLGAENVERVLKAALQQEWTGIKEYSEEWFKVYRAASRRQQMARAFVRYALDTLDHGFNGLDRALIYHGSLVGDKYDIWFEAWAKAVQGTEIAKKLAEDDKKGTLPKELYNHYTIVTLDENGKYTQVAYVEYFTTEIGAIVAEFDAWIKELEAVDGDEAIKATYSDYLAHYRRCLAETDVNKLEDEWRVLDEKWMGIKHWVQIVHDIEYGYGDPLRCKVSPEFSVRLMDETYSTDNETIARIQAIMVEYFKARNTPLARSGLQALQLSMAAIYYLPYLCGVNLFFRFSGQSIPNRTEVREKCGVKIYFDPVSTAAREVFAKELAAQVAADPARAEWIDTIETIVYHVGPHEIGHAIYGLDSLKDVIKTSTKTLLEEPRAELTALHTMKLLVEHALTTKDDMARHVCSFLLQDLRRFAMFDSSATRPYTISAMSCWRRAHDIAYIALDSSGKVTFDDSKALDFLGKCSEAFEAILDAEDRADGDDIEGILKDMEAAESSPTVQHLVKQLFHKRQGNEQ